MIVILNLSDIIKNVEWMVKLVHRFGFTFLLHKLVRPAYAIGVVHHCVER